MCEPFFGLPQTVVRRGILRELGPVALKVYVALWYESERYCTRELKRTVGQLKQLVGGCRNSYTKAIRELAEASLLSADALGSEGFVFHLFDPETGGPWDSDPKKKPVYCPKRTNPEASPPTPAKHASRPKTLSRSTDFQFGCNVPNVSSAVRTNSQGYRVPKWDEIGK